MSSNPRSAVLCALATSASLPFQHIYTCGDAQTTIVKSYLINNFNGATQTVGFNIIRKGGTPSMTIASKSMANGEALTGTTYLVMGPGDALVAAVSVAGIMFWVSGTVLMGVATLNAPPATVGALPAEPPITSSRTRPRRTARDPQT